MKTFLKTISILLTLTVCFSNVKSQDTLDQMPEDTLQSIFNFNSVTDVQNLFNTCRIFRNQALKNLENRMIVLRPSQLKNVALDVAQHIFNLKVTFDQESIEKSYTCETPHKDYERKTTIITNLGLNDQDSIHLARFNKLKNLEISSGRITHLNFLPVECLNSITHLNLESCNQLTSEGLNKLRLMKNLQCLNLKGCPITNLEFLKPENGDNTYPQLCTSLRHLDLSNTKLKSNDGLQSCKNLRKLLISGLDPGCEQQFNTELFTALSKLELLSLSGANPFDCKALCNLESLKELSLSYGKIDHLQLLENLNNIQSISLGEIDSKIWVSIIRKPEKCSIIEPEVFRNWKRLTNLKSLSISNMCCSLKTLIMLPSLEKLDIRRAHHADDELEFLGGISHLTELRIREEQSGDLKWSVHLPNSAKIIVDGTDVTKKVEDLRNNIITILE